MVVSTRDITDRKRVEEELVESERRLRAVTDGAPVILFAFDTEGTITFDAGRGLSALGLALRSTVGLSAFENYRDDPRVLDDLRQALAGEEISDTVELRGTSGRLYFDTLYSPFRDAAGEVEGVVGVATDVTERKRLEEELAHRATHDPLTDLPSRRLFEDRLEGALTRSRRSGQPLAVMFIDLDDFKPVNDGPGDELLVAVAGRLGASLRPEDTICRLGGDEFVVLLEEVDRAAAAEVAGCLTGRLNEPFELGGSDEDPGPEVRITKSIGVALTGPGFAGRYSPADPLREADAAMYRAKQSGKARYGLSVLDA